MSSQKARWLIIITSGLFLLIDQFLKWQVLHNWSKPILLSPYFGWQLFLNKGVAFGIPLSNSLTILITLPMVGLIIYLFSKEFSKNFYSPKLLLAWSLLLAGAVSNLLDRIIYRQVVDYILIGTAIINISDLLIVGGLMIYLLKTRKDKTP